MELPFENSKVFLPIEWHERLFVQTWYGRVHAASLDSHRLRSLDSLAIADEILNNLGNPNIPLYRTKASCEEALELLSKDHILRQGWQLQTERSLAALAEALKCKDEDTASPDFLTLVYHLRRLKSAATSDYRGHLILAIEKALSDRDADAIYDLTGRLLTRLVNEGYSLEGLFGIVANVLIRQTPPVNFARGFGITKDKVLSGESEYQIIMRLTGPSKLLPTQIGRIAFRQEPFGVTIETTPNNPIKTDFFRQGQRTYYAQITVSAREERSAGEEARRRLERVMDALRFELMHDLISVHDEFVYIIPNRPPAVSRLPSTVPNPKRNIRPAEFAEFLDRLTQLEASDRFSSETKSKMESALRYYRFSLDTPQLQNRFINSWTALEYLARDRKQRYIIDGVRQNVVPLLVLPYMRTLLMDFRDTLDTYRIKLPSLFAERYQVERYAALSLQQLLEIIRGEDFLQLQRGCSIYPGLQMSLNQFREQNLDNKKTGNYIKRHKQNVEWHITRLYGARNDIVHSADTSTRLTLLCANLEHYVKICIQEVLDVAFTYQDIASLEEIFAVQRHAMSLLFSDLEKNKDGLLLASMTGAVC